MKTIAVVAAVVAFTLLVVGCSGESLVARGYVTSQIGGEYSISVGSANGLQTGDVLQVVRQVNDKRTAITGKVKVTKVVGENSSTIEALSGTVQRGDRVERWAR
ncbi:MAG: hypothetical protein AB1600_03035 [Bacteroidota bacterium]